MTDSIEEYYNEAERIQYKYFKTGKLTSKDFFMYYFSKSQVALLRSLDEQNPEIKWRLQRKWERAFAQPLTVSIQKMYKSLAEFPQRRIHHTKEDLEMLEDIRKHRTAI